MKTGDQLTTLFRERGLRVTPQRQVIFRLLHGDDAHPTVESLYERALAEMPTMSLKSAISPWSSTASRFPAASATTSPSTRCK